MNMRHISRRARLGVVFLAGLTLAACGSPDLTATTTATAPPKAGAPCDGVEQVEVSSPEAQHILSDLLQGILARNPGQAGASPVGLAEVPSITRAGDWVLVQASFTQVFEPGIFVLQRDGNGYRYDGEGWGGLAESMEEIRTTLAERLPTAPRELFSCLEETTWFRLSAVDTSATMTVPAPTAGLPRNRRRLKR